MSVPSVLDAEHRPRRRADDAVGGQAVAGLQARTAASVAGPNSPSADLQRGLQACDGVAAAFAAFAAFGRSRCGGGRRRGAWWWWLWRAGSAEGGGVSVSSPCTPMHAPGRRADDAVDGQAVAGLQAADRGLGFGAEFAVDGEGAARSAAA